MGVLVMFINQSGVNKGDLFVTLLLLLLCLLDMYLCLLIYFDRVRKFKIDSNMYEPIMCEVVGYEKLNNLNWCLGLGLGKIVFKYSDKLLNLRTKSGIILNKAVERKEVLVFTNTVSNNTKDVMDGNTYTSCSSNKLFCLYAVILSLCIGIQSILLHCIR